MKFIFLSILLLTAITFAETPLPTVHKQINTHLDIDTYNQKVEQEWASRLRKSGHDEISVFGFLEDKAQKVGLILKPESLKQWCSIYEGKQFFGTNAASRITKEFERDFQPDLTTPHSALKSYLVAKQRSDLKFVQANSDSSFSGTLERLRKSANLRSDFINVKILFEGRYISEGREYVALYYRCDTDDIGTKRTSFRRDFFVFMNSQYYLTDAPRSSDFGNAYKLMGMTSSLKFGKSTDIRQKLMQKRSIPAYFYQFK